MFLEDSENSQCKDQVKDIIFHKTHKTSSSSIQNILLLYAKNHNLTKGRTSTYLKRNKKVCKKYSTDLFTLNHSILHSEYCHLG